MTHPLGLLYGCPWLLYDSLYGSLYGYGKSVIMSEIERECVLLRRQLSVQHPSSFMGRERLTFRLHDTPLHIDDDERPEGAVGAIIVFETACTKLIFNDGVGEILARLCAFGGGARTGGSPTRTWSAFRSLQRPLLLTLWPPTFIRSTFKPTTFRRRARARGGRNWPGVYLSA